MNGVYCLTFPNGKRYVGVAVGYKGIEGRWAEYKRFHCKSQRKLYNALKKYGPENVKYEVILDTDDVDNAYRSEMYLIDVWNLQDDRHGYNISAGGKSPMLGRHHTEETKNKMSMKNKGRKMKPRAKPRVCVAHSGFCKGMKHSPDAIEKIKIAMSNLSDETKNKMSESAKKRWKQYRDNRFLINTN